MSEIAWQPGMTLEMIEKHVILKALRFFHGQQTATARALGITTKTLYNKLKKYEVKNQDGTELQRPPEDTEDSSENDESAERGLRLQPVEEVSEKPSVPLPVGEKVQKLPSQKHAGRYSSGRR